MNLPTAYQPQADTALADYPDDALCYLSHTTVGDPQADALVEELHDMPREQAYNFIQAGIYQDESALRGAPQAVQDFFDEIAANMDHPSVHLLSMAREAFRLDEGLWSCAFVLGSTLETMTSLVAQAFHMTGKVSGLRFGMKHRIRYNIRHMKHIYGPGLLAESSNGWRTSVMLRITHARIRRMFYSSDWDTEAWGTPLSAAHMSLVLHSFSAALIPRFRLLGGRLTQDEANAITHTWAFVGHLMGIPPALTRLTQDEALRLHQAALACEPPPDRTNMAIMHTILQELPGLFKKSGRARARITAESYDLSRHLIGSQIADQMLWDHTSRGLPKAFFLWLWRTRRRLGCGVDLPALFERHLCRKED